MSISHIKASDCVSWSINISQSFPSSLSKIISNRFHFTSWILCWTEDMVLNIYRNWTEGQWSDLLYFYQIFFVGEFQKRSTCQRCLLGWIRYIMSLAKGSWDHVNHLVVWTFTPPYMVVPGWGLYKWMCTLCTCKHLGFINLHTFLQK